MKKPLIENEDHFNGSYADWMIFILCLIVITQFIPGIPLKDALLALGALIAIGIIIPILATKIRFRRTHTLVAIKK